MRKKILSALLLGLFTVASTSTFVSCKDYDDDVKDLQNQITNNASTLKQLVEEKFNTCETEIKALNSTIDALDAAYKDADKKLQANIDAASKAAGAAQETADKAVKDAAVNAAAIKTIQDDLAKAKEDLSKAIEDAKAELQNKHNEDVEKLLDADKALQAGIDDAKALAEKAYALAQTNQTGLANLTTTVENIKNNLQGQINVINSNLVLKADSIAKNRADIINLQNAVANLKAKQIADSTKFAQADEALKAADVVLKNKIDSLAAAVDTAKAAIRGQIASVDTKVTDLKNAYEAQVVEYNAKLKNLSDSIKTAYEKFTAIDDRFAALTGDLSSLITSIIYNGQTANAVKMGVIGDVSNASVFPYANKGLKDTIKLVEDSVLLSKKGGYIYATINPAQIDFEGAKVKMVNSQNKENTIFTLGAAEQVTEKDPVLSITRAGQANNLGNGLYKFLISTKGGAKKADLVGKTSIYTKDVNTESYVAYALQTEYKAGDSTRTVTSHYDLAIVPTKAKTVEKFDVIPVAPGQDAEKPTNQNKSFTMSFDIAADAKVLEGEMVIDDAKNMDIYAAYAEVDTTFFKKGVTINGKANTGILYNEAIAANAKISAPDSLINKVIPVKWYVLNYDGSIVTKEENVVFTRSLFGAINVELTDTLRSNRDTYVDFTNEVIAKLRAIKADGAEIFAQTVDFGQENKIDSVKSKVYRITMKPVTADAPKKDSIYNVFKYVPSGLVFKNNVDTLKQTMEFVDKDGLKIATINYTLRVVLPEWYDKLDMRIASAFNVIDQKEPYAKDYTVAWARKEATNADKTKVGYKWDTHSFNIDRFTKLAKAKSDATSYILYKAVTGAPYIELADTNANATASVNVKYIRVYKKDGVDAKNENPGADETNVRFQINQNIYFFGLTNAVKTHDTFWYSVVSPINYGIYRGDPLELQANINKNVGSASVDLSTFKWVDYSSNGSPFTLKDDRIKSVTCDLIEDEGNNYALVKGKTITYNRNGKNNNLTFDIEEGAATRECTLYVKIKITDIWGIATTLDGTIDVNASGAESKKH